MVFKKQIILLSL